MLFPHGNPSIGEIREKSSLNSRSNRCDNPSTVSICNISVIPRLMSKNARARSRRQHQFYPEGGWNLIVDSVEGAHVSLNNAGRANRDSAKRTVPGVCTCASRDPGALQSDFLPFCARLSCPRH